MFFFKAEGLDRKGRPKLLTAYRPGDPDQLAVTVELRYDRDGPYPIGVTVKKDRGAGYKGGRTTLSGRDIQRLPLARYINAAVAFATAEGGPGRQVLAAGAALDEPEPGKKPSVTWIAREYKRHAAEGRSPAKEIAVELHVPPNRVHQWIHEARQAGALAPSPRSRQ